MDGDPTDTFEDALGQATQMLRERREVVKKAMRDLGGELSRIESALETLTREDPAVRIAAQMASESASYAHRLSAREAVWILLDREDRAWTSAELKAELERDIQAGIIEIRVSDLGAAVRSAIWSLIQGAEAVRLSDKRIIHQRWLEPRTSPWRELVP